MSNELSYKFKKKTSVVTVFLVSTTFSISKHCQSDAPAQNNLKLHFKKGTSTTKTSIHSLRGSLIGLFTHLHDFMNMSVDRQNQNICELKIKSTQAKSSPNMLSFRFPFPRWTFSRKCLCSLGADVLLKFMLRAELSCANKTFSFWHALKLR